MSQESTSSANANLEHALLCTGNSKYTKQWRKSLYMIGFLNSVRKPPTSTANYESLPQFIPLPTSEPPARTSSAKSSVAIDICSEDEEVKKDVEERIRSDIAGIVMERDLKSLHELGGVELISSVLVDQRQTSQDGAVGGTPTIPAVGTSLCGFLLNSCRCNGYIILMLLVSAALSFATEFKLEGPKHGWHDPVAILLAVFLLVVGNSMASFWRERKMLRLAKKRSQLEFTIERGEESLKVPVSDIVVGDLVCLKPGDEVPAYGLLVSDEILVLAEAKKCKSRNPFLIYGSKVIEGQGKMVVASVGNKTNLVETSACNPERRCLLESLIEKPISYIDKVALFISVLVAFVVFIRLICKKDAKNGGLPEMKGNVSVGSVMEVLERVLLRPQGKVSILTGLVAVAILSVQHGMPLVVAVSLKYKLDKVVSKQDALLNDLSACATMGLVTVICIDVSGGLISKSMEVSKIWIGEEDITSKFEGSETTDQPMLDVLKEGVGLSVLDPDLSFSSVCKPLVYWAEATWEMNMISFRENFDILDHTKLNDKEGSGVLVRKVVGNEQVLHLHWSGAASTILEMCSSYYDCEGECHAMMENQKNKFGELIKEMEDNGLMSIGFAHRETNGEDLEQDELILIGLIGLKCNCQESIKAALKNLRDTAKIEIKLVSEDDIMVVKDIAYELGMEVPPDGIVLDGKELQDLNGEAKLDKVGLALVMGSLSPEDKKEMVECLKEKGHVVAFIGTRLVVTNHASVLKVADVGIVHDSLSRKVYTDSSSISIKSFSALKPIVMAGRSEYHNIQKFIQLQLTVTISGSAITLITTMITGDSPLTAIQLFWVNVLMCLLGGLMMAMKLTSEATLSKQPSKDRNKPIINQKICKIIAVQVLYQASVSMILNFEGHVTNREKKVRETMIFNIFLLCQLFNQQVLKVVLQSYFFLVALSCCFLMQVAVIEYAKGLADCMQLNATEWAICVLISALPWIIEWTICFLIGALPWIIERVLNNFLSTNYASDSELITTSQSFHRSIALPFLMLLLFPVGLIFSQIGMNMTTFR